MSRTGEIQLASGWRGSATAAAVALLALAAAPARALDLPFLYDLSDANGAVPVSWVRMAHDPRAHELFVLDPSEGVIRVFNRSGMETYAFGDDDALGSVTDLDLLEGGDLVVLTHLRGQRALLRCNFRGEPKGRIEVHGLPSGLTGFTPDRVRQAGGTLYLADSARMRVIATTLDGEWIRTYDASQIATGKKKGDAGFTGFAVDASGNVLFTVAPLFQAFILSPEGVLRAFGSRGSTPGRFNVVAGIAADDAGNLYLVDVLRCVVMVFDPALEFVGEFSGRGWGPGQLIAPRDLVVGDGQVFVTQSAARGVSVFRVEASHQQPGS